MTITSTLKWNKCEVNGSRKSTTKNNKTCWCIFSLFKRMLAHWRKYVMLCSIIFFFKRNYGLMGTSMWCALRGLLLLFLLFFLMIIWNGRHAYFSVIITLLWAFLYLILFFFAHSHADLSSLLCDLLVSWFLLCVLIQALVSLWQKKGQRRRERKKMKYCIFLGWHSYSFTKHKLMNT